MSLHNSAEIQQHWLSYNLGDEQIMCYYLSQWWPSSLLSHGVTRSHDYTELWISANNWSLQCKLLGLALRKVIFVFTTTSGRPAMCNRNASCHRVTTWHKLCHPCSAIKRTARWRCSNSQLISITQDRRNHTAKASNPGSQWVGLHISLQSVSMCFPGIMHDYLRSMSSGNQPNFTNVHCMYILNNNEICRLNEENSIRDDVVGRMANSYAARISKK